MFCSYGLLAAVVALPTEWGLRRVFGHRVSTRYTYCAARSPVALTEALGLPFCPPPRPRPCPQPASEVLFDPGSELSPAAREWRLRVLRAAAAHACVGALGAPFEAALRQHVRLGVYGVEKAAATVAVASLAKNEAASF